MVSYLMFMKLSLRIALQVSWDTVKMFKILMNDEDEIKFMANTRIGR